MECHCPCACPGTGLATRRAADPADAGRALVIGLGGGPLPIYWHASLGFSVEAVELDPCVLDLARKHFGFVETAEAPSLSVSALEALLVAASRAHARPYSDVACLANGCMCPLQTWLRQHHIEVPSQGSDV